MAVVRKAEESMYPEGQSPAERRGQTITVTVAFSLTCVLLCLFIRLYMRWPWRKLMSRNDALAITATVFVIGSAAATSSAVSNGFGHPSEDLSLEQLRSIRRALLSSHLLFYLAASFATMSVVEFIILLKGQVSMWVVDYALRIATPIWGVAGVVTSIAFLAMDVNTIPAAAPIALGSTAIVLQLATFVAATLIAIPLQTDRTTKGKVLLGFSPSLLVIAGFVVSMVVLPAKLLGESFATDDINYAICLQCILLFLIIYATAPALLQLGKRFQTGYTAPVIDERGNTMSGSLIGGSHGAGRSRNKSHPATGKQESYEFKTVGSNGQIVSSISAQERSDRDQHRYRHPTDRPRRDRSVKQSRDIDARSMASDSSQKIIISKTVTQSSVNV